MKASHKTIRSPHRSLRRGAAAVECAILTPLLMLVVLGAIDVGQFANVHQKVSDASREGARVAARNGTKNTSDVQAAVMSYLQQAFPGVPAGTLASATSVTVMNSGGSSISGSGLGAVPSGSELRVQVTLQFDPVRWVSSISGLDGSQVRATTFMRRE